MCIVVPLEGGQELLRLIRDGSGISGLRLRLYQNDYTPISSSVYASFTIATFSGYASASPAMATITTSDGKAVWKNAVSNAFTCDGGGTTNVIYGYYVVNSTTNKILWAERFAQPVAMALNGDTIRITPELDLTSSG